jgi:hypothetical protein
MEQLLNLNIPIWALLAYMVFMCLVQALPRPAGRSNQFYVWVYSFLHLLSCNLALFMDPAKKLQTQPPAPQPPLETPPKG